MKPCKHLDFDVEKYGDAADLKEISGFPCLVKYWHRNERFAPPGSGNPVKVQFCGQGRGRINGIFQCYNEGEMSCYEPADSVETQESKS